MLTEIPPTSRAADIAIEVRCYDFPHRWLINSRRTADWYLVDIEDNDGLGECACDGFQIRFCTALKHRETPKYRCFHIEYVREHVRSILGDQFPEAASQEMATLQPA